MWCSVADTHLKLLDRVVSGASFLTRGVFECGLALVDLWRYCVCCSTSGVIHPLYGALPEPYVPVRVTRCAVIAHRYTYAPPR